MSDASGSYVLLAGGHKTLVRPYSPSELAHMLTEAAENETGLLYIQGTQYGDNGLIIAPYQVVGIVAARF